jgi:hypothetical protein
MWIGSTRQRPPRQRLCSRTGYVNFEHPSLPIYRNLRYFTLDLRLKIEILHTPIMQSRLAANGMPKRLAARGESTIGRVPSAAGAAARRRDAGDGGISSRSANAADAPAPPEPFGRIGIAGNLCVARRQRCPRIASSSRLDLARNTYARDLLYFHHGLLEGVALACPAKQGKCRDSRGRYRNRDRTGNILRCEQRCVLNNDPDTDSDPDPEVLSRFVAESSLRHGTPERLSLSGSHGQRPWV